MKENSSLSGLLETWSDDERLHHKTTQRLRDESFTRMNVFDAYIEYRRTALEQLTNEIKKLAMRQ